MGDLCANFPNHSYCRISNAGHIDGSNRYRFGTLEKRGLHGLFFTRNLMEYIEEKGFKMKEAIIRAMDQFVDDVHWSKAPLKVELAACCIADAVKTIVNKF